MNNTQIVFLDVHNIFPHPLNPRKDLGDLTELADSIKANGVLQNLTVVPKPDGNPGEYLALIGNRRHAASKLAGLEQVPCVISGMDIKQQVATMLLENMQRSDLTFYEQAEGFQMMLDFGETVDSISEKTGFSQATVRRRVKMLELDKDKFQKSVKRGATLQDFLELEKIHDPDLKNQALDAVGTSNFKYEVKRMQDKEKEQAKKAALITELETFATQIEESSTNGLQRVQWISFYGDADFQKPDDAGKRKYFFTVSYNITLYAEPTEEDVAEHAVEEENRQKQREHVQRLNEIAERAFRLRFEFIKSVSGLKKKAPLIAELAVRSMLTSGWNNSFDGSLFQDLMDIELEDHENFPIDLLSQSFSSAPERVLLLAAYSYYGDGDGARFHDWSGGYQGNDKLDALYVLLEGLGYEMSDEERALRDGTHELYKHDDE